MAKSPEQIRFELEQREIAGEFNNLDRNSSAISDNASIGVDAIEQYATVANNVIRNSKIENTRARESRIISREKLNDFEAFKVSMDDNDGRTLKSIATNFSKVKTRCAEGPEATADIPFYYDETDPLQNAEKKFMSHLHPSDILKGSLKNSKYRPGTIVQQSYKDNNRENISLERVVDRGVHLSENFVLQRIQGGSKNAFSSGATYSPSIQYVESNSSELPVAPETAPSELSVKEKWSPKFAPLAVGTKRYTKISVSSGFGYRKDPMGAPTKNFHSGIDLSVRPLSPIVAIDDGVVIAVFTPEQDIAKRKVATKGKPLGHPTSGGAYVMIEHKTNDPKTKIRSFSCHMIKVTVKRNQNVVAGQIIGFVGGGIYGYTEPNDKKSPPAGKFYCTWPGGGGSTGAHLHFSLRKVENGKKERINPLMFEYPKKTVISDEKFKQYITENTKYVNAKKKELVDFHEKVTKQKLKQKGE